MDFLDRRRRSGSFTVVAVIAAVTVVGDLGAARAQPPVAAVAPVAPASPPPSSASPPRAAAPTLAATLPTDAVLAQLLADSLAVVPELASARARIEGEQERVPQAGALPDPMLQVGVQNDGFTSVGIGREPNNFVSLMVAQTLPWPGKRALRREAAALAVGQAQHAASRVRLTVEAEVRGRYLTLQLLRERLRLLDRLQAILHNSFELARVRYQIGAGAQSDLLRAQLELARLAQRRLLLQAEQRRTAQGLNRLRAHPLVEPVVPVTRLQELPPLASLEGLFSVEQALRTNPELAAARLGVTRTQRTLALAQKSALPDLTVSAGLMVRGALEPMWLLSVSGPVPLFAGRKQRREVAERRAQRTGAELEVTTLEQLIALRVEERRTSFAALRQLVELYQQGLLVQSEATTESTLAQYKVGAVPFAAVLEANAGFLADQEGFLEAVAAAHRLLIGEAENSLDIAAMAPSAAGAAMGGAAPEASSAGMGATP